MKRFWLNLILLVYVMTYWIGGLFVACFYLTNPVIIYAFSTAVVILSFASGIFFFGRSVQSNDKG